MKGKHYVDVGLWHTGTWMPDDDCHVKPAKLREMKKQSETEQRGNYGPRQQSTTTEKGFNKE